MNLQHTSVVSIPVDRDRYRRWCYMYLPHTPLHTSVYTALRSSHHRTLKKDETQENTMSDKYRLVLDLNVPSATQGHLRTTTHYYNVYFHEMNGKSTPIPEHQTWNCAGESQDYIPIMHIVGFHPGRQRQVPSVVLHVPPSHLSPHTSVHCTPY